MKQSIRKRLLSFVLAIGVLFTLIPATLVSAEKSVKIAKITQAHYRIRHVASGKYLGIDPNGLEQNGARLQIQNYQEGNELQVFYIKHLHDDYYQIRVHGEQNMILEVRNSSKDDCAEVSQWETHSGTNGEWAFVLTDKNNYKIANAYSVKLMNVRGNDHTAGNDIIQYHQDETEAEVFALEHCDSSKIISAVWTRDWKSSNVMHLLIENANKSTWGAYRSPWTLYDPNQKKLAYPNPDLGERLAYIVYLGPTQMKNMLLAKDPIKSNLSSAFDVLTGEATEMVADAIFSKAGMGWIPSGMVFGMLSVAYDAETNNRWNDFKKAAKEYTALRIEVSYDFEMVWIDLPWPVLNTIVKVRYYGWDGSPDSINRDIGINGSWEYIFK